MIRQKAISLLVLLQRRWFDGFRKDLQLRQFLWNGTRGDHYWYAWVQCKCCQQLLQHLMLFYERQLFFSSWLKRSLQRDQFGILPNWSLCINARYWAFTIGSKILSHYVIVSSSKDEYKIMDRILSTRHIILSIICL